MVRSKYSLDRMGEQGRAAEGGMETTGKRAGRRVWMVLFVLTAMAGVACGSGLSREELLSANVPAFQAGSVGQAGGNALAAPAADSPDLAAGIESGNSLPVAGSSPSGSNGLTTSGAAGKVGKPIGTGSSGGAGAGEGTARSAAAPGRPAESGPKTVG